MIIWTKIWWVNGRNQQGISRIVWRNLIWSCVTQKNWANGLLLWDISIGATFTCSILIQLICDLWWSSSDSIQLIDKPFILSIKFFLTANLPNLKPGNITLFGGISSSWLLSLSLWMVRSIVPLQVGKKCPNWTFSWYWNTVMNALNSIKIWSCIRCSINNIVASREDLT